MCKINTKLNKLTKLMFDLAADYHGSRLFIVIRESCFTQQLDIKIIYFYICCIERVNE